MSVYAGHSDIIYVGELEAREKELRTRHALVVPGAESLCVGCDEDEHEELEQIIQFREDVFSECGERSWTESSGFVADTYFNQYQYDRQKDIYGQEVVDSQYWDDEQFTDDAQDEFTEIDFDGVTYWVDREV